MDLRCREMMSGGPLRTRERSRAEIHLPLPHHPFRAPVLAARPVNARDHESSVRDFTGRSARKPTFETPLIGRRRHPDAGASEAYSRLAAKPNRAQLRERWGDSVNTFRTRMLSLVK